jgi:hypothetical protein
MDLRSSLILKQISNRKEMQFVKKQDIFKGLMWFAYTNNFVTGISKIEKVGNHRRKKLKTKYLR